MLDKDYLLAKYIQNNKYKALNIRSFKERRKRQTAATLMCIPNLNELFITIKESTH